MKLMDIQKLLLQWGLKIKVLHRLPGRLRLDISALRKVPSEKRQSAQDLIRNLVLPEGITSIEPSFITGSVLLKYDPEKLTEQQVIKNIQELVSALVKYRDELWSVNLEDGPAAAEKVNGVLDKANRKHTKLYEDDSRS
jgi:hypothetical protein